MNKVLDKTHLINIGGWWRYNRRLPKDLIGRVKDTRINKAGLIRYSLNTHDLSEAVLRRNLADIEWDAIYEAAKEGRPLPLTRNQAVKLIQEYVERTDRAWHEEYLDDPPSDETERRLIMMDTGTSEQILTDLDDPRGSESVSLTIQKLLKNEHYELSDVGIPLNMFGAFVRRGLIEIYRRHDARLRDDFSIEFIDQMFSPNKKIQATFGDLCDQFLDLYTADAKAKKISSQQINQTESRVRIIRELIGNDLPVQSVNYDLCLEFRNRITGLPKSWAPYKELSVATVLKKTEDDKKATIGHETRSEYLRLLTKLLDLAHKKELVAAVYSEGLTPTALKTANFKKRDPFSKSQLITFFTSEYYMKCASAGTRPYEAALSLPWRFWLPLMCLLMGMRPNEVCQMLLNDVRTTDDGVAYLDIVETIDDDEELETVSDIAAKTVKTDGSRRKLPLHPALLKMGFLDYVKALKVEGATKLFPDIKPNKWGNHA